jgi:alpha-D-ribose 1-methylphosphonate 5-triphosphate synthase subunit PhnH
MMFDYVHDIQKAYRKLLDSTARPGKINSLAEESQKLDLPLKCNKGTLLLMLMLLDNEVTFHILGREAMRITQNISQLTYARVAPLEEADFIFVLEDAVDTQLVNSLEKCKLGDLINPHLSASFIVEVAGISPEKDLILQGPGIRGGNYLSIDPEVGWLEKRAAKNREYPLGIEMYFLDRDHKLAAIPRTTIISKTR